MSLGDTIRFTVPGSRTRLALSILTIVSFVTDRAKSGQPLACKCLYSRRRKTAMGSEQRGGLRDLDDIL